MLHMVLQRSMWFGSTCRCACPRPGGGASAPSRPVGPLPAGPIAGTPSRTAGDDYVKGVKDVDGGGIGDGEDGNDGSGGDSGDRGCGKRGDGGGAEGGEVVTEAMVVSVSTAFWSHLSARAGSMV